MLPGTNNKQKIRSLAVQEVTRDILPQNGECREVHDTETFCNSTDFLRRK
jgi:hypothetical protein